MNETVTKTLELTSDVVFKAFMTSNKTLKYKSYLLSEITKLPREIFMKAEYKTIELNPKHGKSKVYRTDVFIETEENITFILEMNNAKYKDSIIKSFAYSFRAISEKLDSGDKYKKIGKHTLIDFNNFSLDNFNILLDEDGIVSLYTNKLVTDIWKSYRINLVRAKDKCYNEDEERIRYLLKIFDQNEIKNIKRGIIMDKDLEDAMMEAVDELERIRMDKKIIGLYDAEKRERMIRNSMIDEAKEEGLKEGMKEGMKKGKIITAKEMFKQKIDINIISKCTGLSIKELNLLN